LGFKFAERFFCVVAVRQRRQHVLGNFKWKQELSLNKLAREDSFSDPAGVSSSNDRGNAVSRGGPTMARFVEVAKKSQIPENGVIGVEVEGKTLALVNLGGMIYALDDSCPHEAGPLSEGQIEGEEIVCPWHASHFDIKTGRVTMDPAMENIATYKVRVVDDAVEVEL
jgi:3-phenylpropionate/trans-cinnamate dioxygenase ferredoxin component